MTKIKHSQTSNDLKIDWDKIFVDKPLKDLDFIAFNTLKSWMETAKKGDKFTFLVNGKYFSIKMDNP